MEYLMQQTRDEGDMSASHHMFLDPEVVAYQEKMSGVIKHFTYEQALEQFNGIFRSQKPVTASSVPEQQVPLVAVEEKYVNLFVEDFRRKLMSYQHPFAFVKKLVAGMRSIQMETTVATVEELIDYLSEGSMKPIAIRFLQQSANPRKMIEKILNGKPAGAPLNSAPRKRRPAEDGEREREEAPIDTPTSDDWWMLEDADSETLAIDPQEPAMALPGSPEKVLILAARHRHGCNLWHPHDLTDHSKRHIAGVTQERGNMLDLERHDRLRGM